jgi:hypothetical protein
MDVATELLSPAGGVKADRSALVRGRRRLSTRGRRSPAGAGPRICPPIPRASAVSGDAASVRLQGLSGQFQRVRSYQQQKPG